jgi:hypothetical protein
MERVHISYLFILLLVILGSLVLGIFVAGIRNATREKRHRTAKLHGEAQLVADREKAFRDKYGQ